MRGRKGYTYANIPGLKRNWRSEAKCFDEPMSKWSTVEGNVRMSIPDAQAHTQAEIARAEMQCAGCPVRRECAVFAHLTKAQGVIMGGYSLSTTKGRRKIARYALAEEFDLMRIVACSECHAALRMPDDAPGNAILSAAHAPLCPDCRHKSDTEIERRERERKANQRKKAEDE